MKTSFLTNPRYATATSEPFTLRGYAKALTHGTATVVSINLRGRWRRALSGLATLWTVAAGCVFIPIAHFILVPGFGLAGLVTFLRRLGQDEMALLIRGTCPDCGEEQVFGQSRAWRDLTHLTCGACQRALTVGRAGED